MRVKTLVALVVLLIMISLAGGIMITRQIEPPTRPANKPMQRPVFLYSLGGGIPDAALSQPMAVVRHPDDNIYVTDMGHQQVKVYFPNGSWAFSFGKRGEGPGRFNYPYGLAVLDNGDVLVGDPANGTIQRFTKRGKFIEELIKKKQGLKPGLMTKAPGNLVWVSDLENHQVVLMDGQGRMRVKIGGDKVSFRFPQGLALAEQGSLWVADAGNFMLKLVDARGRLEKTWSSNKPEKSQNMVRDLDRDWLGRFMVTDPLLGLVRVIDKRGKELFTFGQLPGERGLPLSFPMGIHVDQTGKIFIVDRGNNLVQVWGYPSGR